MHLIRIILVSGFLCIGQYIQAQSFEARETIGIQSRWKGMQVTLVNNNAFSSHGSWIRDITRMTLFFSTQKRFNFGLGYQQIYTNISDGTSKEHRPLLFLRYQKDLGVFQLRDFSTMELRYLEGEHSKRYRNQLDLRYRRHEIIQPFVLTEAFIHMGDMRHVRQRVMIGTRVFINKLVLNFFSFYEKDKGSPSWIERTALGVAAIYRLSDT